MTAWKQLGLSSDLVRHLRAVNRVSRTEIDGHVFAYPHLKAAWLSEDGNHIVLTHQRDPIWQQWTLNDGWHFIGVHKTEKAAEKAAEQYVAVCPLDPGTYVQAQLTPESRLIRIRCESAEGPGVLKGIFERMDYTVSIERVGV